MPLRRIAVLGGNDVHASADRGAAAGKVGQLLAEQGIEVLHSEELSGSALALVTACRGAGGSAVFATDFRERADGFVALPGGTIQEQLIGVCLDSAAADHKPCGFLNTADDFRGLLEGVGDVTVERLIRETQRGRLIVEREPAELLRALLDFRPPETRRQRP